MLNKLTIFVSALVALAALGAWIGRLTMAEVSKQWFADCTENVIFMIVLFLGVLGCFGSANYFRYAAYGPYRTLGGFRAFLLRIVGMTLWIVIGTIVGVYFLVYLNAAPRDC